MNGDREGLLYRWVWVQPYAASKDTGFGSAYIAASVAQPYSCGGESFPVSKDAEPESLKQRSHRPSRRVLNRSHADLTLGLHDERKLDSERIQGGLLRLHIVRSATEAIRKVLQAHERASMVHRRPQESPSWYSCPVTGNRLQADTMKVRACLF